MSHTLEKIREVCLITERPVQGPLHCPHPARGLEGLAGELPPGFGPELVPRVLQMTSDALHLPFFLTGIPRFYSCLCFAICYQGCLGRDVSFPFPISAERQAARESPGPTPTHSPGCRYGGALVKFARKKPPFLSHLRCGSSHWLDQKSFTQNLACV